MSDNAANTQSMGAQSPHKQFAGLVWLFLISVGTLVFGFMGENALLRPYVLISGISVMLLVLGVTGWHKLANWRGNREYRMLQTMLSGDAAACFTTDSLGQILYKNHAAGRRFQAEPSHTLIGTLRQHIATPSAVLFRLQMRAESNGWAREDVVSKTGHFRLSVNATGPGRFMWRIEEFADKHSGAGRGAESLSLPMLTANKAGVVLFANESMRRVLGQRPRHLDRVFTSSKLVSGEQTEISTSSGNTRAFVAEVQGYAERREIYLFPVADTGTQAMPTELEALPVAMMTFHRDGQLIDANAVGRQLLGLSKDGDYKFHTLFSGLGRSVKDWLADVADGRLTDSAEVLSAHVGDTEQFVQITLSRVVTHGRPSILAVLQDATALKTLEAQFVQSQKMHAIGQLAGGVAHDFNNLLTAISGHCDLLLIRHNNGDQDYGDLIQIHQNANRAAALVGQLLAFSRKQTLKPERLDIQELLSDLAHLLNRLVGEKVKLILAHGFELGIVKADRRQLEQVVMNLVVNARDAMPMGGQIRIETEALILKDELRRDQAMVPAGEYVAINVSDSGVGIPADSLQKIFEPFYTTKKLGEGTGLGLSTAYGIIKQSGGYIFVDSTEGAGTVFQLLLPVYQNDETAHIEIKPEGKSPLLRPGEGVVLLVEDEAAVRSFASRALRMRGYTVIEAASAEEALDMLADPKLKVDVFVTDVVMPGLDGPSWVRLALESRPGVKVIFVSGYAQEALSQDQALIPNSIFLPKPFSLKELTTTVQSQMH